MYPTSPPREWTAAIGAAGCRVAFLDGMAELRTLSELRELAPSVESVVLLEPWSSPPAAEEASEPLLPHQRFVALLDDWSRSDTADQLGREETIGADDPALLLHSPGSGGAWSATLLLHGNLVAQAEALTQALRIDDADVQLLGLPFGWAFAQALLLAAVRAGSITALSPDEDAALLDTRAVHPTFMGATAALCERIYRSFIAELPDRSIAGQRVLAWARSLGSEVSRVREAGKAPPKLLTLQHTLLSKLAFKPLRSIFGGELRFIVTGGAPISRGITQLYHAAELPILEGYVLTQAGGMTHVSRPGTERSGAVGTPVDGVEAWLSDEGTVIVRGPMIAPSERGPDGWLDTGDRGSIDDDGTLTIFERGDHLLELQTGQQISPRSIEALLEESPFVAHALVCGQGRPFVSAIVALDPRTLARWAQRKQLDLGYEDLCRHPEVYQIIADVVAQKNTELADYEVVKKFAILDDNPTVIGGELTPVGELRRGPTSEKYRWIVDSFYSEAY
jgi:long-chain acyl-CoA synthetase